MVKTIVLALEKTNIACLNFASGFNTNFAFIFAQPQPIDSQLRGCIGDFLRTVQDPDLVCLFYMSAELTGRLLYRDNFKQLLL